MKKINNWFRSNNWVRVNNGLWLFRDHITLNAVWATGCDLSEVRWFDLHYNGWRLGDRCFHISLRITKLVLDCVFWSMPFQRKQEKWWENA